MAAAGEEEDGVLSTTCPAGEEELRRVAAHLDSLLSTSFSARSFPGKWQPIRARIGQLSSALSGVVVSGHSPVLSSLLRSVTSTVDDAFGLAGACADESYAGGKLLMRSNLDLLASKLDLHARSLEEIYAAGALSRMGAIVLSKPGTGATREDMRTYVRELFARAKVGGDPDMASRALAALSETLLEDDRYARIAAVEIPDAAGVLVSLLVSRDVGVQEQAAGAVAAIARFEAYRPTLALAGAVAALIRLLETGSASGKERAARALQSLTEKSDNAWSISAHGGVTVLLKICSNGISSTGEIMSSACGVLMNLVGVGEIRRFMVDQGAIEVFVELARSVQEVCAINAVEFLQAIAGDDGNVKARIIREGGVDSLVAALNPSSAFSSKAREIAFKTIESLCFSPASSVIALLNADFLNRVLFFLQHGETSVQEAALKTVSRLCGVSADARRAMGDAGFMPELVRLVGEAKSADARNVAAEALARLVEEQRNRRRFMREGEQGIGRILQLLSPEEDEKRVNSRFLLAALTAVSGSNSGRRRIAGSGHVKNLEKLADRDVAEAKRIIKRLSSNKLLSLLSGFFRSSS